ncbi:hypothetical protein JB92DRAFT_2809784 [Gautieria morchelliformis]|nr:hypothetical protein JB92DRAFT_2809784 [Gautieria morchelliformis]
MASLTSTSEVTLVSSPTAVLTYTLTNDNPLNTSLVDLSSEYSRPAYKVETHVSSSKTITIVRNSEEDVIASLEWRETLPDKVTIGDKPSVSLNSWMKPGLLPLSPVSFHDDQGRKYQWRNVAAGLDMELYAVDTAGGPIAAFCKAHVDRTNDTSTPATFRLTARAREIADTCVVSFLFLEKKRRMRENSARVRTDSKNAMGLIFFK